MDKMAYLYFELLIFSKKFSLLTGSTKLGFGSLPESFARFGLEIFDLY